MPHQLAVGASGMLRDVCKELLSRGDDLTVIARTRASLDALQRETRTLPGTLHPLQIDYRKGDMLRHALAQYIQKLGPITGALLWIHSTAPKAPGQIAQTIGDQHPWNMARVLGSASAAPDATSWADNRASLQLPPCVRYQEVILGFEKEGSRSRWLTHREICQSTLKAWDGHDSRVIAGKVKPWSSRP